MVGCGHMGSAIVSRWLATGTVTSAHVRACTARSASANALQERFGFAAGTNLADAVVGADVVVLGFKPQVRGDIVPHLGAVLAGDRPLVISLMAGVGLDELRASLGPRLARWMPNTPVATGAGIVGQSAHGLGQGDLEVLACLADPLGVRVDVGEGQFDALTAVAGCGPAYVFAFCEALTAAGQAQGLDRAMAEQLAKQVVIGAGHLLAGSAEDASELRRRVTSKGGMTEAALAKLQQCAWAEALLDAVGAAVERGQQLAQPVEPAR